MEASNLNLEAATVLNDLTSSNDSHCGWVGHCLATASHAT